MPPVGEQQVFEPKDIAEKVSSDCAINVKKLEHTFSGVQKV
jgi:hypothetical protein